MDKAEIKKNIDYAIKQRLELELVYKNEGGGESGGEPGGESERKSGGESRLRVCPEYYGIGEQDGRAVMKLSAYSPQRNQVLSFRQEEIVSAKICGEVAKIGGLAKTGSSGKFGGSAKTGGQAKPGSSAKPSAATNQPGLGHSQTVPVHIVAKPLPRIKLDGSCFTSTDDAIGAISICLQLKGDFLPQLTSLENCTNKYRQNYDVAKDWIGRVFPAPQITYDRFMGGLQKSRQEFLNRVFIAVRSIADAPGHSDRLDANLALIISEADQLCNEVEKLWMEISTTQGGGSSKGSPEGGKTHQVEEALAALRELTESLAQY